MKMAGGDLKLFRYNSPTSAGAGNWEADIFVFDTAMRLYGGYNRSDSTPCYITLGGGFTGNHNYVNLSDDRLKSQENPIVNATETLMKLKPQTYWKRTFLGTEAGDTLPAGLDTGSNNPEIFEAGLVAQEVYYEAPELRFLVKSQQDMSEVKELPEGVKPEDIHDQEWSEYGWSSDHPSSFSYTELVPYLIRMCQEQQNKIESLSESVSRLEAKLTDA